MASQENEKAMDGLLRRSLARDGAVSPSTRGECPSPELLAAYYDRTLGATEVAEYELHFSQCTRCREQLAMMVRSESELGVNVVPEPAPVAARTPVELAVGSSRGAVVPAKSRASANVGPRPRRLLELRWLLPVAAALILSTFIFVRFASRGTGVDLGKQVAMSTQAPRPQDQQNEIKASASESDAAEKSAATVSDSEAYNTARSSPAAKPAGSRPAAPPVHASRTESTASRPGAISRPSVRGGSAAGASRMRSSAAESVDAEPPPSAPPPELNAALPSIPVAADSAATVQPSAPPAPATTTAQPNVRPKFAMNGLGVSGRNAHGAVSKNAPTNSKSASDHSSTLVIATPDSNVLYRTAGGGVVERSQDAGATWRGQLLNPSAEFTAGSCPATNICWLTGRAGVIFATTDGTTWKIVPAPSTTDSTSIEAKDALSATVTANDGRKWSTEDGGDTWSPAN
jgi:hypothetical protein